MVIRFAAIVYFIGVCLLPLSEGGWLSPSMVCYYLASFAVGLHLARSARRLSAGNGLGLLACWASPVCLPLLAAGVRWLGDSFG